MADKKTKSSIIISTYTWERFKVLARLNGYRNMSAFISDVLEEKNAEAEADGYKLKRTRRGKSYG